MLPNGKSSALLEDLMVSLGVRSTCEGVEGSVGLGLPRDGALVNHIEEAELPFTL